MRLNVLLSSVFIFSIALLGISQSNYREIGLKSSNLTNNYNFLFKKEKKEGQFRRYSADLTSNTFFGGISGHQTSIRASIGFEKRKEITDKFDFIRGFNPGVQLILQNPTYPDFSLITGLSLGYILGFQYHINKEFAIGAEMIPGISLNSDIADENLSINAQLRLNQSAGIFFIYKFNKT